eukprot:TRINITY_DN38330_c0_g1_i1.p1 TRINITY_DN38330_c0_g1~~TRINITY_DN38330_c0_g1_i1.p1  ORF type:complete len:1106 (-),score=266.48 TRINITY_DN38330_c0_g1_i1:72-3389(-)
MASVLPHKGYDPLIDKDPRELAVVKTPGGEGTLKRRGTSALALLLFSLFLFPSLKALVTPSHSDTCYAHGRQLTPTDNFLSRAVRYEEFGRKLKEKTSNSSEDDGGKGDEDEKKDVKLSLEDCTIQERSTMTLWCALGLVLLLKLAGVSKFGDLIGDSESSQRPGIGGIFFRLVALWNFWGPVCILCSVILKFEKQFSDSYLETVKDDSSRQYYLVEHPANLTDLSIVDTCVAFDSYAELRTFAHWALGAGAVLAFTVGSLLFGFGELLKLEPEKGYCLNSILHLDFLNIFQSCWQQDELMASYDSMLDTFNNWTEENAKSIEAVSQSISALEDGAMAALAGPAKHMEKLGRQRLLTQSKWCLEPLFKQHARLSWDEALLVLEQVSVSKLVELGPEAWFQETLQTSMPVLKTIAIGKLFMIPTVAEWCKENFLDWASEVAPVLDAALDLNALHEALANSDKFLTQMMDMGPIAMKIVVRKITLVPSIAEELVRLGVDVVDAIRALQRISIGELQDWAKKLLEAPANAADFVIYVESFAGPVAIAWTLAKIRPKLMPFLEESSVSWADALDVLQRVSSAKELESAAEDFGSFEKKYEKSFSIAKARVKIEPELEKKGYKWPLLRDTLEQFGDLKDVELARSQPGKFMDELDDWKKRKQEEAEKKETSSTEATINAMERTKMIWPALCQCAATALWLLTSFVTTSPCVESSDGGPIFFGVYMIESSLGYVKFLVISHLAVVGLLVLFLTMMVVARHLNMTRLESYLPLVMAASLGLYTIALAHLSISKKALTGGSMSNAASKLKQLPIGAAMSAGFAAEASARVTASVVSVPSEEERKAQEERRRRLIEEKMKQLAEAAPKELKGKMEQSTNKIQETIAEVVQKKDEDKEEEERRKREAEERFLREQEEAARKKAEEDEALRKRAEEEREAEEARKKAEAERRARLEEALERGADIDLDLPFVKGFSRFEDPEQSKVELDTIAEAILDVQEQHKATGGEGTHALNLTIQVSTLGKANQKDMGEFLDRRANAIRRELLDRGIPPESLQVGEPIYQDSRARAVIRAAKVADTAGGAEGTDSGQASGSAETSGKAPEEKVEKKKTGKKKK